MNNLKYQSIMYICLLILFIIIINIIIINSINTKYYTKYALLKLIPEKYVPKTILYNEIIDLENLNYPLIFKTNKCDSYSFLVEKINNYKKALKYINKYPFNKKNIIIQDYVPYNNEVGIFIYRDLITNKFNILSAVIKNTNNIIKIGCLNSNCIDITNMVGEKLINVINNISSNIKGLNWGRYDIKYKDLNSLLNGKFYILELNDDFPSNLTVTTNLKKNPVKSIYIFIKTYLLRIIISIKNICLLKINLYDLFMKILYFLSFIECTMYM